MMEGLAPSASGPPPSIDTRNRSRSAVGLEADDVDRTAVLTEFEIDDVDIDGRQIDGQPPRAPLDGDQPPDAAAFWKALSPLRGEENSSWSYAGSWTCLGLDAAFDPRPGLTASGTWQLAPAEPVP
jgi:hypothetical protein